MKPIRLYWETKKTKDNIGHSKSAWLLALRAVPIALLLKAWWFHTFFIFLYFFLTFLTSGLVLCIDWVVTVFLHHFCSSCSPVPSLLIASFDSFFLSVPLLCPVQQWLAPSRRSTNPVSCILYFSSTPSTITITTIYMKFSLPNSLPCLALRCWERQLRYFQMQTFTRCTFYDPLKAGPVKFISSHNSMLKPITAIILQYSF